MKQKLAEKRWQKKLKMLFLVVIVVGLTGLGAGCVTKQPVTVINYSDSEYYETIKNGETFYCMSKYYVDEVMQAKIKKINP